jgi:hypothetical protein
MSFWVNVFNTAIEIRKHVIKKSLTISPVVDGYFNEGEYSKSLWYQSAPLQTNSYRINKYIENG